MANLEKEKRALREQEENDTLRRLLFWLGAAVHLEAVVMLGNRYYFHYLTSEILVAERIMNILGPLQYVGFIIAAAFGVWAIMGRKKDKKGGLCRTICAAFFAMISVIAILFRQVGSPCVSLLLAIIPCMAGLIMIYYLYQREFFCAACLSGLGILGLWIFRSSGERYQSVIYVYIALAVVFAIAMVYLAMQAKKNDGLLKLGERKLMLFKPKANYTLIFASAALAVLLLVIAPFVALAFAYFAFWALIVWLFVLAVYFTAKMM